MQNILIPVSVSSPNTVVRKMVFVVPAGSPGNHSYTSIHFTTCTYMHRLHLLLSLFILSLLRHCENSVVFLLMVTRYTISCYFLW